MAEVCKYCGDRQVEMYKALDKVIAEYKGKPGALIPVLHQAQQIFGCLPKEVQIHVAEGLDVPLGDVYGVITFYAFFSMKPKGKYQIGVCMGTACYVKGAVKVLEALEQQLGIRQDDTTEDGKFSLEVLRCIGACGLAPAIKINDEVYGRMTAGKVAEVLAKYA
ncbi:MAG: NAD(P)H-dependent oxidoreductase subunit E [bacterium]|jgi:NADH:ubiquinone oxidoreductase subunit E